MNNEIGNYLPPPNEKPRGPGKAASAALAGMITILTLGMLTAVLVLFGGSILQIYGWALFGGVPFGTGFISILIYGARARRSFGSCMIVALLAPIFASCVFIIFGIEGIICSLMASIFWIPVSLIGAMFGFLVHRKLWKKNSGRGFDVLVAFAVTMMPIWMGGETIDPPKPAPIMIESEIEIAAPPMTVWNELASFGDLAPPTEFLFKMGVAYPVRAELDWEGTGAERRCILSTGPLVERVTCWNPGKELAFDVLINPPSMKEWSLYGELKAAHLEGYVEARHGRFVLTPLPSGGTKVTGTSWYTIDMYPQFYWRLWSDKIVRDVQMRVLTAAKDRAESKMK
jgi:hypothetical protein